VRKRLRSARPEKEEPAGHAPEPTATAARDAHQTRAGAVTAPGRKVRARVESCPAVTDGNQVAGDVREKRQRLVPSSGVLVVLTVAVAVCFAATVGPTAARRRSCGTPSPGPRARPASVAECVEDATTAAVLADLGCDVAQGYAVARPMPVDAFLRWLSDTYLFAFDESRS
jgi:hypothetical protein